MPVYATPDQLRAYLAGRVDIDGLATPPPDLDDDTLAELLDRAERDVDRVVGPWPLYASGRKFDPATLPLPARDALSRAACAAAEYRLTEGETDLIGETDFLPPEVGTILRRGPRVGPKVIEELAGSGLLRYSGTVTPDEPASPLLIVTGPLGVAPSSLGTPPRVPEQAP